jgi:hypothetical protein
MLSAHLSAGQSLNVNQTDTASLARSPYPLHRQAYLLNQSGFLADSILQNAIQSEMEKNLSGGLQRRLAEALSINYYLSGRIKAALQHYDQRQIGASGQQRGKLLYEMGLLLLDQHAPIEAGSFFAQSVQEGYENARFPLLVSLLESGHFDRAALLMEQLVTLETHWQEVDNALQAVFEAPLDSITFPMLYYRAKALSPKELILKLNAFSAAEQRQILIKLAEDLENEGIDPAPWQAAGIALPQRDFTNEPLQNLLAMASERPFDENLVIHTSEKLLSENTVDAYNLVTEALEYNPNAIALLKQHALLAIEIGLPDYADNSMKKLNALMEPIAFAQFEILWYQKKRAREDEEWMPYEE